MRAIFINAFPGALEVLYPYNRHPREGGYRKTGSVLTPPPRCHSVHGMCGIHKAGIAIHRCIHIHVFCIHVRKVEKIDKVIPTQEYSPAVEDMEDHEQLKKYPLQMELLAKPERKAMNIAFIASFIMLGIGAMASVTHLSV